MAEHCEKYNVLVILLTWIYKTFQIEDQMSKFQSVWNTTLSGNPDSFVDWLDVDQTSGQIASSVCQIQIFNFLQMIDLLGL